MIANHIHDALSQVRRLQTYVLEKRLFKGFSGRMRMISGTIALVATLVLSAERFPDSTGAHLAGWGIVLVCALALNYGALLAWFLFNPQADRRLRRLTPAFDAMPALVVGGVLSLALILHGQFDLLFGTWMCLYGIAHIPYRLSLPRENYGIGLYYVICGVACVLAPQVDFRDPWPMGIVFFAGEWIGGFVLHHANQRARAAEEADAEN